MNTEVTQTPQTITFEVERSGFNFIDLRWTEDLRSLHGGEFEHLFYTLSGVKGIEELKLRRYSAMIAIAPHIADKDEVVAEILSALESTRSDMERSWKMPVRFVDYDKVLSELEEGDGAQMGGGS